jgi:subtilisin family serine protease
MRLRAALVGLVVSVSALVGAGLGAAPAVADEGVVEGAGAPDAVAGQYLVTLGATPSWASAQALAERYGGELIQAYHTALPGFSARMTAAQARRLAADPAVESVVQDRRARLAETQANPPSWGLDRIDQTSLPLSGSYTYPSVAAGVTVYVIDTGMRIEHSQFGGRASHGWDFVDNDPVADDCHGHGTHVAGTIGGSDTGVAKGVTLVSLRVLGCTGWGSYSGIIAAIDWVTANAARPAVVNMSIGGTASDSVNAAVQNSIASGVTYAVAAGNEGADACGTSPASAPDALTVAASDANDTGAAFSNFGSCVDLFAPGVHVTSAGHASDTATAVMSGTSMASPHVAGAAALVLAGSPAATPAQVRAALMGQSRTEAIAGAAGSPNVLLQVPGAAPTVPAPAAPAAPVVVAAPAPCWQQTNASDVRIRDRGTATSTVHVAGCAGRPGKVRVEVHVVHPRRGDVTVELVAPNGSTKRLRGGDRRDKAADIHTVYTTTVKVKSRNGTWKLRVRDGARGYTGHIDSWTLTL